MQVVAFALTNEVSITLVEDNGWRFSHWERIASGPILLPPSIEDEAQRFATPDAAADYFRTTYARLLRTPVRQ